MQHLNSVLIEGFVTDIYNENHITIKNKRLNATAYIEVIIDSDSGYSKYLLQLMKKNEINKYLSENPEIRLIGKLVSIEKSGYIEANTIIMKGKNLKDVLDIE